MSMDAADPGRRQLGVVLLEAGLLSERDLAVALAEQERSGRRLGEILVARGLVSGPALANALAEQHGGFLRTEHGFGTGLRGLLGSRGAPASPSARPDVGPPPSAPAAGVWFAGAQATSGGSADEQKSLETEPAEVPDPVQPLHATEGPKEPAALPEMSSSEQRRAHDLEVQTLPQPDPDHLLFVPTTGGYLLLQRTGEAPPVGRRLELPEAPNVRLCVSKVARSPLPLDKRICAYLQAL
jgi:hypothetical protein